MTTTSERWAPPPSPTTSPPACPCDADADGSPSATSAPSGAAAAAEDAPAAATAVAALALALGFAAPVPMDSSPGSALPLAVAGVLLLPPAPEGLGGAGLDSPAALEWPALLALGGSAAAAAAEDEDESARGWMEVGVGGGAPGQQPSSMKEVRDHPQQPSSRRR